MFSTLSTRRPPFSSPSGESLFSTWSIWFFQPPSSVSSTSWCSYSHQLHRWISTTRLSWLWDITVFFYAGKVNPGGESLIIFDRRHDYDCQKVFARYIFANYTFSIPIGDACQFFVFFSERCCGAPYRQVPDLHIPHFTGNAGLKRHCQPHSHGTCNARV